MLNSLENQLQAQKSLSEEAAEDYVKSNHSSEMNSASILLQHLKMQCFNSEYWLHLLHIILSSKKAQSTEDS